MELLPDISGSCRTCMQISPVMMPIFGVFQGRIIASIVTEFTSVQIFEDDDLPQQVCTVCFKEMDNFMAFIKKSRDSDRQLRELLKKPVIKEENTLDDVKPEEADEPFLKIELDEYSVNATYSDYSNNIDDSDSEPEQGETSPQQRKKKRGRKRQDSDAQQDSDDEEQKAQPRKPKRGRPKISDSDEDRSDDDSVSNDSDSNGDNSVHDEPRVAKKRGRKRLPKPPPSPVEMDDTEREVFDVIPILPGQIVCCKCFKTFATLDELKTHGKTHEGCLRPDSGKKDHYCKICFRRYSNIKGVNAHRIKTADLIRLYECKICQFRCAVPLRRKTHAHNHKKGAAPVIPEEVKKELGLLCCAKACEKSFPTKELLLLHGQTDHKHNKIEANLGLCNADRPFQCQVCWSCFYTELGLEKHAVRKYRPKRHQCSICGEKFAFPADLELHERIHRNERDFPCQTCPKRFYTETQLRQHLRRHAKKWNFVCNLCGKAFKQKAALQAHILAHEGKLPFVCEVCNKAFRVKTKMMYHMRTHTGERPYPCRHCDSAFADHTNRMRHELIHFKNKNQLQPQPQQQQQLTPLPLPQPPPLPPQPESSSSLPEQTTPHL